MSNRTMRVGTVEYLDVTVTSDVTLDTQPVAVSLDHEATWLTAAWTGSPGTTRTASVLLGDTNPLPPVGVSVVLVKVTDNPEAPIIDAGYLTVVSA